MDAQLRHFISNPGLLDVWLAIVGITSAKSIVVAGSL
jgi:hypothetical protein